MMNVLLMLHSTEISMVCYAVYNLNQLQHCQFCLQFMIFRKICPSCRKFKTFTELWDICLNFNNMSVISGLQPSL